jgi:hypothetical protein
VFVCVTVCVCVSGLFVLLLFSFFSSLYILNNIPNE